MNLDVISTNLRSVLDRMAVAARRSGRKPEEIQLVAVTKKRPNEAVKRLMEEGVVDLGENYPQELWRKVAEIDDARVHWHLIGHLQSNKAERTYPLAKMIHAVDSLKLLRFLDDLGLKTETPVELCLQVNVSREPNKHGWSPEGILIEAESIAAYRNAPIVGLMTIAAYDSNPDDARRAFAELREVRDRLRTRTEMALPHLSMGMSGDFEVAIEEGATVVRVGSALFEGLET